MSARTFAGRSGRGVVLIVAGVLAGVGGAGAAVAVASSGSANNTVYACVETVSTSDFAGSGVPLAEPGNVRIIDPSAGQSCNTTQNGNYLPEEQISWNQTGPQGPAGNVVTLANQTFTISGINKIATVAGSAPATSDSGSDGTAIGTLKMTGGMLSLKPFPILSFNLLTSAAASQSSVKHSSLAPIQIVKSVDASSPLLFRAATTGDAFGTVVLTVSNAGGGKGLQITLTHVVVTTFEESNSGGKHPLRDTMWLSYKKITIKYLT